MSNTKDGLNPKVQNLGVSATLAINEISRELQDKGQTVYKLGLGQSPFPVPDTVVEELRAHATEKDYLPVQGLLALREAVANFHEINDKVNAQADNVMIGPGSKELLFLLQLAYQNKTLLPSPCWVSYAPQAQILGKKIDIIQTTFETKWKITAKDLKKSRAPKLLVLNYPNNPTGLTYTAEELKDIAEVARERKFIVLSDEIYGQTTFSGEHISIARFYPEGTIISSGLSKWCGAGGWRLGTFVFPEQLKWLMKAMCSVASETYTSVNAPTQYAAIKAFQSGEDIDSYLSHSKRILSTLANECAEKLLQAEVKVHPAEGGFYLFPDFVNSSERLSERGIYDSKTLCQQLLQDTGVAILPGSAFGRPSEELTARLAFVDFNGKEALEASYKVGLDQKLPLDFTQKYCGKVVKAIDELVGWI